MNKIAIFIITLMMILSLCACGGANGSAQQTSDSDATDNMDNSAQQDPADVVEADNMDDSEQQNNSDLAEADNADGNIDEAADEDNSEDGEPVIGVPNPIGEATAFEILEQTGVSFVIPEGAKDVAYYIIDMDGSNIAEMTFMLNGAECTCRICGSEVPTGKLEDISGMYYEWTSEDKAEVGGNAAELYWLEGEQGIVLWYDYVPGLLYSLGMDAGSSRDSLLLLAEELYIPVQGDADEESAEELTVDSGDNEGISTADSIVALAESLIGAEYEWGAAGPDTFDNSGFVYYCFYENGITLPRKTADMFAAGTAVELEDLMPGDLVFFTYNEDRSASYVGIYIGDGEFIAENNENSPVCIHDMTLDYYVDIYVGARRYF